MAEAKSYAACTSVLLDVFRNNHGIVFHELILLGMKQREAQKIKKIKEGKKKWKLYH